MVKMSTNGNISYSTPTTDIYRQIQKLLLEHKVPFHTFNLPEDRSLKVVPCGIPDIIEENVKSDLENRGFEIKFVKRFGTAGKSVPICVVYIKLIIMH